MGYKLNIWDVGGQLSLRPFWRNYFEKTDTLAWVVDATALDRLDDCKRELEIVLEEDRLKGAGLLILVNKLDALPDEKQREDALTEVKQALGIEHIQYHECEILGCSAYLGTNLTPALDWIVTEVKERLYLLE